MTTTRTNNNLVEIREKVFQVTLRPILGTYLPRDEVVQLTLVCRAWREELRGFELVWHDVIGLDYTLCCRKAAGPLPTKWMRLFKQNQWKFVGLEVEVTDKDCNDLCNFLEESGMLKTLRYLNIYDTKFYDESDFYPNDDENENIGNGEEDEVIDGKILLEMESLEEISVFCKNFPLSVILDLIRAGRMRALWLHYLLPSITDARELCNVILETCPATIESLKFCYIDICEEDDISVVTAGHKFDFLGDVICKSRIKSFCPEFPMSKNACLAISRALEVNTICLTSLGLRHCCSIPTV